VLAHPHLDAGMALREVGDGRQQRAPDRGGEPRDAQYAGRLRGRVQVEASGVDGREDRDGVLGQAVAGRRQTHAPTVGLDERSARVARQGGDALGDGRRGRAQLGRDLVHRAEPGELQEQPQPSHVHGVIVSIV
jgi:hypothetical protein